MEQKFFVARAYRYKESGNWDYKMVGMYNDLTTAKQAFHSNMGSIIKDSNDIAMCIIFDSFGSKIDADFDSIWVDPEEEVSTEEGE